MRFYVAASLWAVLWTMSCKGPSVPSSISDEPVCSEFDLAGETMRGGLKRPVRLRVLAGEEVIATVMAYGLSGPAAPPTRFLLPDATTEYALEWAQCPNERAATPFDPRDKKAAKDAGYSCEEPAVYSTVKHQTRSGDPATHQIAMPAPPDAACLEGRAKKPAASAAPAK